MVQYDRFNWGASTIQQRLNGQLLSDVPGNHMGLTLIESPMSKVSLKHENIRYLHGGINQLGKADRLARFTTHDTQAALDAAQRGVLRYLDQQCPILWI